MHPRIIRTREEFDALREPWNRLVDTIEDQEPFYRWEWAAANFDHLFDENDEFFIVVLERGKDLFAIAPLCIQREGFGPFQGKVLRTITGDHADYGAFYLHPDFNHRDLIKRLLKALFSNRDSWDLLHLLNFSSRSSQSFLLSDVAQNDFHVPCRFSEQILTPYFRFGKDESKIIPKEIRNIERRERDLRDSHNVEITIDGKFSEQFWNRMIELHRNRWQESNFLESSYCNFIRQVIRYLEPVGATSFSWMKIDGELVALELGFQTEKKIGSYMPAYDPRYSKFSPGGILLKHLMEHFSDKKEELDFMRGNEMYKFFWTDSVAANHNLLVESGSTTSKAFSRFIKTKDNLRDIDWLRKAYRSTTVRAAL